MTLSLGTVAPPFQLRDQTNTVWTSKALRGNDALIVFIPFAFSGVCEGEVCSIRDGTEHLESLDTQIVVVTCDSVHVNAKWAQMNSLRFPLLSDFWPHGSVAKSYNTFNETLGCANRTSFVLDAEGKIRSIFTSEHLGAARDHSAYLEALAAP